MGNKKTSLNSSVVYAIGALIVIWFAVLVAPYADEGLGSLIRGIPAAVRNPFHFQKARSTVKVVAVLLGIYMAALLVYLSDNREHRRGEEYGSAKWGSVLRLNRKFANRKDAFDNKILTQNVSMGWDGHKTRRNLNTTVIGGAGAGKSQMYAILNILQGRTSLIVTDPSGELLRATGWFLTHIARYKVKVLDFINIEKSDCYNPFCYIRQDDDILKIADILFKNTTPKDAINNDPFWDNQAKTLLCALMFYLYHEAPPEEQNFPLVMDLIRGLEINDDPMITCPLDVLFERLAMRNPDHIAVKYYKDARAGANDTVRSVKASLISHMSKFNMESMKKLTMTDDMDLSKLGEEKTAIFMLVPETDTSYNFLAGMLYMQAFSELYAVADKKYKGRLPIPVHFLMDEFANIVLPNDFEKIVATCRKRNICVSIILQGLSQLQALYKDHWQAIIGNCDEFLYMGSNEKEAHKYVSEMLGKQTIEYKAENRSKGRNGSFSKNQSLVGRELLAPDEIGRLDEDMAILFIKGCRPVMDRKYDPEKHPNHQYNSRFGAPEYDHGTADFAMTADDFAKYAVGEWEVLSQAEIEKRYLKKQGNAA